LENNSIVAVSKNKFKKVALQPLVIIPTPVNHFSFFIYPYPIMSFFDDPEDAKRVEMDFETPLESYIPDAWSALLADELKKPYWNTLVKTVDEEYKNWMVYPQRHQVFDALRSCNPHNVKIVVIGQDPYIRPGQAHGMSFSVQEGCAMPPSLRNIYRELLEDPKVQMDGNPKENLEHWASQGVLLLNSCLTVRAGKSASHKKLGWGTFTSALITALSKAHP
jgi:uracil-DNA glycosylase